MNTNTKCEIFINSVLNKNVVIYNDDKYLIRLGPPALHGCGSTSLAASVDRVEQCLRRAGWFSLCTHAAGTVLFNIGSAIHLLGGSKQCAPSMFTSKYSNYQRVHRVRFAFCLLGPSQLRLIYWSRTGVEIGWKKTFNRKQKFNINFCCSCECRMVRLPNGIATPILSRLGNYRCPIIENQFVYFCFYVLIVAKFIAFFRKASVWSRSWNRDWKETTAKTKWE